MRDIVDVINQIKQLTTNTDVIAQLDNLLNAKIPFTDPDTMYIRWNELGFILNRNFPVPLKNDNEVKIVSVFTNMSEEEIRKRCTK